MGSFPWGPWRHWGLGSHQEGKAPRPQPEELASVPRVTSDVATPVASEKAMDSTHLYKTAPLDWSRAGFWITGVHKVCSWAGGLPTMAVLCGQS